MYCIFLSVEFAIIRDNKRYKEIMLYPQTLFQCDYDSKGMKTVLKSDYYFNTSILPSYKIQKGAITRAGYSIDMH